MSVTYAIRNSELYLRLGLKLAVEARSALGPHLVHHLMLEAQQMRLQLVHGHAHVVGQLVHRHRRVEPQVRPDRGQQHLLLHLVHKDLHLKPQRLLVHGLVQHGRVEGRGHRRQELWTGEGETRLELAKVAGLHLVHLIGVVLLLQHGVERLVDALRVQHEADGEQDVHLLRLLVDLIVLVGLSLKHATSPLNVEQDVAERPDGVGVTPHHEVREAHVVVHGDLAAGDARVETLLVQLDLLEDFDGLIIITEQRVKPQESDEREVAHHLVQRVHPELAGHRLRIPAGRVDLKSIKTFIVDIMQPEAEYEAEFRPGMRATL